MKKFQNILIENKVWFNSPENENKNASFYYRWGLKLKL